MATFTMELRKVIEFTGGTTEVNSDGVRVMTGGDIGLNTFTTFDPEYKPFLVGKIIDHFYMREIAHETVQLFQLQMRKKMNEIMPYYNQLYATEKLVFDPLSTIKIHTLATGSETGKIESEGDTITDSDTQSKSRSTNLVMPQTALSGNSDYATSGVDANSDSEAATTSEEKKTTESDTDTTNESTTEGYQAYPSQLLAQYRATILNIDMQIIGDLEDLFMGIWNTGDSYTTQSAGWMGGYGFGGYGIY